MQQNHQMSRSAYPTRGYPIYIPGPNEALPAEDRAAGTRIGDLGRLLFHGGFHSIFNLCLSANHPFNQRSGVPETFEQVDLQVAEEHHEDVAVIKGADPKGHTLSKTRKTANVFESATLVLPDGTDKWDLNVSGREQLEAQAKKNAMSWYFIPYLYCSSNPPSNLNTVGINM
ncbi:hypothetical protein JVT61DRAFT_5095 [Boletus reticuloceps]|uniref:Uncharacterized protein n=1 Tax=Boletus reticuloceps TaxID=495285 RepID=A0A8I2Z113_9AGAM|nr:hypothetical protein JVT61DRAFT_5095 [Boletus reticuloceps]